MKLTFCLLFLAFLTSCASTMPGNEAETSSDDISANIAINDDLTEGKFRMYQISIMNNTNEWIDVDSATFETPSVVKAEVLLREKIESWIEAKKLEKNVSDYNTDLLLGSIALAGVAVAAGSNHPQTSALGIVAFSGSVAVSSVKGFLDSKNKTEFQELFPVTHLFHPFLIPPKKVIQRWILLEYEKVPADRSFVVELKTKNKGEYQIRRLRANKK